MLAITEEGTSIGMFEVTPVVHTPTITTLYALIESLQERVEPEEDAAVTIAVARLCQAGYVKVLHVPEDGEMACTHESPVVSSLGSNRTRAPRVFLGFLK